MTNWNERMRQEDERQRHEVLREPENPREVRRAELETALDGIISSLGIVDILEGVRSDVWGMGSEVRPFSTVVPSSPGAIIKKGFTLNYDYEVTNGDRADIVERRFGRYEVGGFWAGGGLSEKPLYLSGTKTKIGWHEEIVGYNITTFMSKRSISMGVYVQGGTSRSRLGDDIQPRVGFLGVREGRDYETALADKDQGKGHIEAVILQDCLRRQRNKSLPTDLLVKAQANLRFLQEKMRGNPYKY